MSKKLVNYLRKRASIEGVEFELEEEFFEVNFNLGVRTFFGVVVDENCNPIFDEQEPKDHPGLLNSFLAA